MWIFVVIGAVVIGVVAYNYGRGKRASDELDRELELNSDAISTPPLLPPNVIGQSHLEYPSEPGWVDYPSTTWWRTGDGPTSIWMAFVEKAEGISHIEVLTICGKTILDTVIMSRKDAYDATQKLKSFGWRYARREAILERMKVEELNLPEEGLN